MQKLQRYVRGVGPGPTKKGSVKHQELQVLPMKIHDFFEKFSNKDHEMIEYTVVED